LSDFNKTLSISTDLNTKFHTNP